jgi:hypothetical protein
MAVSCHDAPEDKTDAVMQTGVSAADAPKYMGYYNGSFGKGIITVAINYISGKNVSGYDLHKGLRRNLNGTVTNRGDGLQFALKEPGDNPLDGVLYLFLDTAGMKLKGKWQPLDSTRITAKNLVLSRIQKSTGSAQEREANDLLWRLPDGGEDTTLLFKSDGSCEYAFYLRPQDSTSQLITIKGTYHREVDTFRVEWQKNSYTPAQVMKLIETRIRVGQDKDYEGYDLLTLKGHGWIFSFNEGSG